MKKPILRSKQPVKRLESLETSHLSVSRESENKYWVMNKRTGMHAVITEAEALQIANDHLT